MEAMLLAERLLEEEETPFRVTDFKQWVYCPRLVYYALCLPQIRPETYMMEVGRDAGRSEALRQLRRSLRRFGLPEGRCELEVPLRSARLGLRGKVDMVIWVGEDATGEVIPVDYKYSRQVGLHVQMQLVAYGLLLEESSGRPVKRGFLYEIPLKKAVEVPLTAALRRKTLAALQAMRSILSSETMPEPTAQRAKCVLCEFRRFCNDVL